MSLAPIRTLVVDNYDSFTYNLVHYLGERTGINPVVIRNDDPRWRIEDLGAYHAVVISPGPGRPDRPADFGICADVIRHVDVPLLGVCLGHQGLAYLFGGDVVPAPEPYHGRTSPVWHIDDELFAGIPSPFHAVRYHSLMAARIPAELEVIATVAEGIPMALRHRQRPLWGVQFHPESICTEHGRRLLGNFVDIARRWPRTSNVEISAPRSAPAATGPITHRVLSRRLSVPVDAQAVFDTLYRDSPYAFWLDSSGGGRFSFMGDASGRMARVASVDVSRGEVTEVDASGGRRVHRGRFFDWLRDDLLAYRIETPALPFDFALGWVGYLGYELKAETGGVRAHRSPYPDAFMVFADRAVAFDHERHEVYLLALAPDGGWLAETAARLDGLASATRAHRPVVAGLGPARLRHGRDAYLDLIDDCQRQIWAGETYEVCLTNMVEVPGALDPWPAYRAMRRANPVPYGAFLRFADLAVLSFSPELFLRVDRHRIAESRPIKGTRPRGTSPADDARLRGDLATSVKDRAENLMIVDLVRNDLGSVAESGSVTADRLFEVESYSTVHQLVSTVRARLGAGMHAVDCVRAAFPGGSMTGAPKIRTMEIIDRLEGGPRGVYSGSIGYLSLSGAADLSVTIRTLVATPGLMRFGVGGAIISLSDPEAEFEETAVKAATLLSLIGQEFPGRRESAPLTDAAARG
jgi:para-aminobenzoate synthetase